MRKFVDRNVLEASCAALMAQADARNGLATDDVATRVGAPLLCAMQRAFCDEIERGATPSQLQVAIEITVTNLLGYAATNIAHNQATGAERTVLAGMLTRIAEHAFESVAYHAETGVVTRIETMGEA